MVRRLRVATLLAVAFVNDALNRSERSFGELIREKKNRFEQRMKQGDQDIELPARESSATNGGPMSRDDIT